MAFVEVAANTLDDSYSISNSLRFNDGDSPRLALNPASTGNQDRWTLSLWVKRGTLGAAQCFFASTDGSATSFDAKFDANDSLDVYNYLGGGFGARLVTNRKFRDVSAWYHIVIVYDSGNATEAQRLRIYVNGTEESSFSTTNYPTVNEDSDINVNGSTVEIGRQGNGSQFFDGYMAEIFLLDGTVYAPTAFGETDEDTGIWIPIDAKGDLTFGTNGFYFEFKQTGTGTDASGMGADTSGNNNHYAPTNLAATDVTTDTPTNNFCVWNGVDYSGDTALAEGNTEGFASSADDYHQGARGSIAVSSGKWYWEVKAVEVGDTSNIVFAGIISADHSFRKDEEDELLVGTYGMRSSNGNSVTSNGSALAYATYGAAFVDGDILNLALDMDNNRLYIGKGGSWADGSGNIDESSINSYLSLSTTPSAYMPMVIGYSTGAAIKYQANFGNAPHSISSGNADANGYGNFEYAVPSGYYALCTKNLAEYG